MSDMEHHLEKRGFSMVQRNLPYSLSLSKHYSPLTEAAGRHATGTRYKSICDLFFLISLGLWVIVFFFFVQKCWTIEQTESNTIPWRNSKLCCHLFLLVTSAQFMGCLSFIILRTQTANLGADLLYSVSWIHFHP